MANKQTPLTAEDLDRFQSLGIIDGYAKGRMLETIEFFGAALKQIVDYEPPFHNLTEEQSEEMASCADCAVARERKWPPGLTCDRHYKVIARRDIRNQDEQRFQHATLRQFARNALCAVVKEER